MGCTVGITMLWMTLKLYQPQHHHKSNGCDSGVLACSALSLGCCVYRLHSCSLTALRCDLQASSTLAR